MILASNSPRRKAILEQLGLNVIIKTKEIEEISHKSTINEKIKEISEKKAKMWRKSIQMSLLLVQILW